ncbi:hypothetical protein T265_02760 [Opisthorchis viverrini]|uniref:Uncharacterized protein n=1 Tax=Opisthorchis viverrini TaxID=6198 RepID=A0A075A5P7_OPIVI|nr:hypothetical protein T265_02760 [Opisthorchis viverrini]KER30950.1 hypothetical protein T265_02760 [Opisthorchis viverrini]
MKKITSELSRVDNCRFPRWGPQNSTHYWQEMYSACQMTVCLAMLFSPIPLLSRSDIEVDSTARELYVKIGEYRRKINRSPRNADEYQALLKDSAIAEHALDTGHKTDLENVEVLRRGPRFTSHGLVAEAVEIAKHPSVNRIEGGELASMWTTASDQSS